MFALTAAVTLLAASASAHPLRSSHEVLARHHVRAGQLASRTLPDPAGWFHDYLEDYTTYHTRYQAIGCTGQQGTAFFDSCCHPMLATETLEANRAADCNPANISATSSAPAATATATADDEDCDDEDEEESAWASITPSSSEAAPAPTTSSTKKAAETTSSSEDAPAPTTTEAPKETTTSSKDEPSSTSSSEAAQPTDSGSSDSQTFTGGRLTWFTQNGVAGNCGTVHQDSDIIAAMNTAEFSMDICGKKVKITTPAGKSLTVTVADSCPGCNPNSIDLSTGAFQALASLDDGIIDNISWSYV